jgi:hypothetical protein
MKFDWSPIGAGEFGAKMASQPTSLNQLLRFANLMFAKNET